MIYIEHRKNLISELENVSKEHGVEIDLRSDVSLPGKIHLAHDPWVKGDDFEDWLTAFSEQKIMGTIILNTKEDSLEAKIKEILEKRGIDNYLFLDTTTPTFVKWAEKGFGSKFYLRLSKYEKLDSIIEFKSQVKWLWVDCFDLVSLDTSFIKEAKKYFKLCMVSPELHGGDDSVVSEFLDYSWYFDAVCTKKPHFWKVLRREVAT